jgi:hypothetical protein
MGLVGLNLEFHLHFTLIIEVHRPYLTRNNSGNADVFSMVQSIHVAGLDVDVDIPGAPPLCFGKPHQHKDDQK